MKDSSTFEYMLAIAVLKPEKGSEMDFVGVITAVLLFVRVTLARGPSRNNNYPGSCSPGPTSISIEKSFSNCSEVLF